MFCDQKTAWQASLSILIIDLSLSLLHYDECFLKHKLLIPNWDYLNNRDNRENRDNQDNWDDQDDWDN